MTDSIGVAVIGAGMAGRSHAHAYRTAQTVFGSDAPPVRLVAIADVNTDFANHTKDRYGFERAARKHVLCESRLRRPSKMPRPWSRPRTRPDRWQHAVSPIVAPPP